MIESVALFVRILASFSPAIAFMILLGFMQRLAERPHAYLAATAICLSVNVALNYFFVGVLGAGIAGSALATGLSYASGLLVVAPGLFKGGSPSWTRGGAFTGMCLKSILSNGSSEGVNYAATALILTLFNHAFMAEVGPQGVAAFAAVNYIGTFATTIMFGIADGIGSIVSCNYGAGKMERVRATLHVAEMIDLAVGCSVCALFMLKGAELASLFIKSDPTSMSMAAHGAAIYGIAFLFNGFNIVRSGYLTSIGNAAASAAVAAGRGIAFIVIGMLVLPQLFGLDGVWMTLPFAEAMTALICLACVAGRTLAKDLWRRT